MNTSRPVIYGRRHAVVAGHYLASLAGMEILQAGGNAIDAGVAAGIALGVLESELVSCAGVAPIIIYSADADRFVTISGLGTWPATVRPDLFMKEHGGQIPPGILRTVVPAAPDAWITALTHYGTMGFADVASAAISFAAEGFHMYPLMAHLIEKHYDDYNSFDSNRALYLPGGAAPTVGSLFRQPDLAQALQFMADEDRAAAGKAGRQAGLQAARDTFYKGDLAATMAAFHRNEGGLLTLDDLAGFSVEIEEPASITFGDATIYGCGPWCQGPMLLQALKILEGFDLHTLGHNSAEYLHLIVETLKLAAADRERYIGDPRFLEVPLERLLSDSYAAGRRLQIDPEKAWPDLPPPGGGAEATGTRPGVPNADAAMDTSYVCAVDKDGNVFSATPSDGSFKSPVVPGMGMVLSPRGQQSWADPAHPSCVAPGKRPRLTPNPAIAVTRNSIIPFGSPGGDVQTQAMLQTLLNHLVFGFDVQQAVELPRVASYSFPSSFEPHRSEPGVLRVEARLPEQVVEGLADRGHKIEMWDDHSWLAGAVSMIDADIGQGARRGAADPRRMGYALAY